MPSFQWQRCLQIRISYRTENHNTLSQLQNSTRNCTEKTYNWLMTLKVNQGHRKSIYVCREHLCSRRKPCSLDCQGRYENVSLCSGEHNRFQLHAQLSQWQRATGHVIAMSDSSDVIKSQNDTRGHRTEYSFQWPEVNKRWHHAGRHCSNQASWWWRRQIVSTARIVPKISRGPATNIWLTLFQISSKSVHFRRRYSWPREGRSFVGPTLG